MIKDKSIGDEAAQDLIRSLTKVIISTVRGIENELESEVTFSMVVPLGMGKTLHFGIRKEEEHEG